MASRPPFNAVSFRKEERVGKIDISGGPLKLSEWLGLAWLALEGAYYHEKYVRKP